MIYLIKKNFKKKKHNKNVDIENCLILIFRDKSSVCLTDVTET